VSLPADTTMYLGDTLLLNPFIDWPGSYSFKWSPEEWPDCPDCESVNIFILQPLKMQVIVTNQIGCKDSASTQILVEERVRIFVPNAFSPNKDGINDLLRAYSGPEIEEILHFNIHDRWGSRIFEQSNISPQAKDWGWNGLTRDMELQPGVFVYHLKVRLINGKEVILAGELTLVR
jgi:gliding motility-associated-like protein